MTITLRPEQEQLIAQAIGTGAYHNPDEVIERALEALLSEEEWLLENRDAIHQKIERAIEQIDRGEGVSTDKLRERLASRKAAYLSEHAPEHPR